jgi:predicted dithiol-disulfide oxidoreductase (DUF899 family)
MTPNPAHLDALQVREKAPQGRGEHGAVTRLDAIEGCPMIIAYYFMWSTSSPAPEQCEGCTFSTTHINQVDTKETL